MALCIYKQKKGYVGIISEVMDNTIAEDSDKVIYKTLMQWAGRVIVSAVYKLSSVI